MISGLSRSVVRVMSREIPLIPAQLYDLRNLSIKITDLLTWTRTGTRKDSFGNDTELAQDTKDAVDLPGNMQAYGVFGGATNLVGTRLTTDWFESSSSVNAVDLGGGLYRVVFDGTGAAVLRANITSAANNRVASCWIRLVSGSFSSGATDYIGFRDAINLPRGTTYDLTELTSEWVRIDAFVSSSFTTTQLVIRSEGDQAATVEVMDMRAVDSTAPYPAFANGTIAGETYGPDIPSFSGIAWPEEGTIMLGAVPCGYDGADNPNSSFARFLEINGVISVSRPGNILLQDSVNSIATGVAVDSCVPTVLSVDFDGSTMGIRVDDVARMTAVQTDALAGDLILGNLAAGNRAFQGKMSITIYPKVLTDAEYEIARQDMTDQLEKLL